MVEGQDWNRLGKLLSLLHSVNTHTNTHATSVSVFFQLDYVALKSTLLNYSFSLNFYGCKLKTQNHLLI